MYNKLFTKILDSSIWLEPTPTRIVWLTFIAAMDENGFVEFAGIGNVAHRARVTVEEATTAIFCLEGPDTVQPDQELEGKRIERVPGGWMVLNAGKYRDLTTRAVIQDQTRERVRRFRARNANSNASVTLCNAEKRSVTTSDTDTDTESEIETDKNLPKGTESSHGVNAAAVGADRRKNGNSVNARSRRPIFSGQRFVVFDWQLEDLSRLLGQHTEDFDLHSWFFDLDAKLATSTETIPQRDGGKWLIAQCEAEARRRGLKTIRTFTPQAISDTGQQNLENMKGAIARIQGRT